MEASYVELKIKFLNDSEVFDRDLATDSFEIAPINTHTQKDWAWRQSLKAGDLIDCADTSFIWYNSMVLDRQ